MSLQCLAEDAALSSLTLFLSVSSVNIESPFVLDFPNDVFLRLHMPHASGNAHDIQLAVSVLDFVRSVHLKCSFSQRYVCLSAGVEFILIY